MALSNASMNAWVLDQLDIRPTDHVLDFGSGPGVGVRDAHARAPEGLVVGVDASTTMVAQAINRNAAAVVRGKVVIHHSVEPLSDASFDKIFSINTLPFVEDAHASLRELHRVLKDGGTIAVAVQSREPGATIETARSWVRRLEHALAQAGFRELRSELGPTEKRPTALVVGRK